MTERQDVAEWIGCRLDDVHGARIGRICAVYLDRKTEEPLWLLARTGRTRAEYHAVPVTRAGCGNGRVWTPFARGTVLSSPPVAVRRRVSRALEAALCRHYDVSLVCGAPCYRYEPSPLVAVGDARDAGAWAAIIASRAAPAPGFSLAR